MNQSPRKKNYYGKGQRIKKYNGNFDNYNASTIARRNKFRYDAYVNAMSGFGGTYDPITRLTYNYAEKIDKATIETLYSQDWLSRKIIETIPDDCTRKWIDIHMQDEDTLLLLQNKMEELDVVGKFKEAMINARLYGGSAIILGIANGQKPIEPLDCNNIDDIMYLNVIDRHYLNVRTYYRDPFKPDYGKPEIYRLNTLFKPDDYSIDESYIHESRIIRFDGAYLPELMRRTNNGWNDSVLNAINQTLKQYGTSVQAGAVLFQDFISKVLKMPNLVDMLQSEEGRSALELRLQYAIANFSSLGIVLLGEDEEFSKIQTPISGLADLIDKYIEIMAASSNIPRSRLFGQSLGTLAGATETTRAYYDYITAYQQDFLKKQINIIITLLFKSKNGPTKGNVPEEWNFKFNSLWDETNKEITTARKMQAQTDDLYIKNKTLTAKIVRKSRFRADGYSFDTTIEDEDEAELEDIEKKEKELEAENNLNNEPENNKSKEENNINKEPNQNNKE